MKKKITILLGLTLLFFVGIGTVKADTQISQLDNSLKITPTAFSSPQKIGFMLYGFQGVINNVSIYTESSNAVAGAVDSWINIYGVHNLQSFSSFTTSTLTFIASSSITTLPTSGAPAVASYAFSNTNLAGFPQFFFEIVSDPLKSATPDIYGTTSTYAGANGTYKFYANFGNNTFIYSPIATAYPQGEGVFMSVPYFVINFITGQSVNPQDVFRFNFQTTATTTNYWLTVPNCAVQTAGSSTLDQVSCWVKATTYDFLNTMARGVSNLGSGLGNAVVQIFPLNLFNDINSDIAAARASSSQVSTIMIPTNASSTMGFTILQPSTAQDIRDKIGSNVQDLAGKIFYALTALGVVVMVGATVILITRKNA